MVDRGQEKTIPAVSDLSLLKKKELLSSAMKRTSEWIFSQEIPSDVNVQVGEATFTLHKFPLVSKCGHIRKLVSESSDADVSFIELNDTPGGAEAFELAAKFCYGINFEISIENIAALRCVAEYLEMTEDYSVGNLVSRADAYLNEVALKTIPESVSVLHKSESLLPVAERAKLVSRCVDAIAYIACKESQFCASGRADGGSSDGVMPSMASHQRPVVDWWAEDLTVLRIDIFQRVLIAMMARGFKQYAIGPILMLYAQKSLRGLQDIFGKGRKKIEPRLEHEKRVVVETVVSLLPREKNAMSVSFLSMLLRAAIYLETTVACRLDLEKRMAMQLGQAVLDDLLIPSYSYTGDTLFDVDTVQRIMTNYLESQTGYHLAFNVADDDYFSPSQSDMERVGKLMENYLAEIATDRNLPVHKFVGLAELIPEQYRPTEDGMYRAIDIYLKAHPNLSDVERKKVCGVMDCQKLSREACAHAAQNDRLPVQTVVQVLYYEQQRLRDAMNGGGSASGESPNSTGQAKMSVYSANLSPVSNELSTLRRENQDLKLELVKLKMKLKEIENSTVRTGNASPSVNSSSPSSADKPPLPRKSFISSVSKKLGRLSPFVRGDGIAPFNKTRTKPNKNRRHSIS